MEKVRKTSTNGKKNNQTKLNNNNKKLNGGLFGSLKQSADRAAVGTGSLHWWNSLFPGMGLLEVCEQAIPMVRFGGYYKVFLQVHPNGAEEDQIWGRISVLLGDKGQRVMYNEQGIVDEGDSAGDRDAYQKILFKEIRLEDSPSF